MPPGGLCLATRSSVLSALGITVVLAGTLALLPTQATPVLDLPQVAPLVTANVVFPATNLSHIQDVDNLASFLVTALDLPRVNMTVRNPLGAYMCCLFDMNGHTIAMENESMVVVELLNTTGMNIFYSSTGLLAKVELIGAFGPPLPQSTWSAMVARSEELARGLGLSSFSSSISGSNNTGEIPEGALGSTTRQTTVAMSSDSYSLPIAFGNQLSVTFDANRGIAVRVTLFPWFTAPAPTVSASQATTAALDYLNRTVPTTFPVLSNGSWVSSYRTSLGLDFLRYALVYDVEATYTAESHNPPGYPSTVSYDYRAWVDAYNGNVTYSVWVLRRGPPPTTPWWPLVLLLATVAAVAIVGSVLLLRRGRHRPAAQQPSREPPTKPHG